MTTAQDNSLGENPKKLVVMYVPAGMPGHLVPTVELGNLLVAQGLEVTVVISGEAEQGAGTGSSLEAANPSLSFRRLAVPAATLASGGSNEEDKVARVFQLARASNQDLRDFLRSVSSAPAALVLDFFCGSALDVGAELGIPTYFLTITCIASVALVLYQKVLHEQTTLSFRDLGGGLVRAPGLPPIPTDHLPAAILDRDSLSNKFFLDLSQQLSNSQGVIVNSCRSLEPRAYDAVVAGICTFQGRRTPPLHCVWPLIKPEEEVEEEVGHDQMECLAWLDGQPTASVVFLCFGSLGRFGAEQTKQIAAGLEASGQRFLWAVRPPPAGDMDLDGFRQRTKDRGLLLLSWAPQRRVLAHHAVGGFVTHCGWNSVLEAITAGVPMLAWPLYAEQRVNKVLLVEEMRLAVAMEGYDKGMVETQEVAAKVTWLIESDGGRELRRRTQEAMQLAKDDGESKATLMNLAKQWKGNN